MTKMMDRFSRPVIALMIAATFASVLPMPAPASANAEPTYAVDPYHSMSADEIADTEQLDNAQQWDGQTPGDANWGVPPSTLPAAAGCAAPEPVTPDAPNFQGDAGCSAAADETRVYYTSHGRVFRGHGPFMQRGPARRLVRGTAIVAGRVVAAPVRFFREHRPVRRLLAAPFRAIRGIRARRHDRWHGRSHSHGHVGTYSSACASCL